MAGKLDSESRMGVTLRRLTLHGQGLDQVVALSQANINESLEYHFTANRSLCKFEASLKTETRPEIKGILAPPKIELVDIENEDQALYVLEFVEGEYTSWSCAEPVNNEPSVVTKFKLDAKGWRLAFYVAFSLRNIGADEISASVKNKINVPGSYSIDELLIDFGMADFMKFDWGRSSIAASTQIESKLVKETLEMFVSQWLDALRLEDPTGAHNVLGSALKVEYPSGEAVPEIIDLFAPSTIRLQTINYQPDGDSSQASTSHDHYAFLFTEMCLGRRLPKCDLQWTGDWFYPGIGGTLVMSRSIFWDNFLAKNIEKLNLEAVKAVNALAKEMSMKELPNAWLLSDIANVPTSGAWTSVKDLENLFEWKSTGRFVLDKEEDGLERHLIFDSHTEIMHSLKPLPGSGKIILTTSLVMTSNLNITYPSLNAISISGQPFNVDITSTVTSRSTTNVHFHSIAGSNQLGTDVTTEFSEPITDVSPRGSPGWVNIPGIGPKLNEIILSFTKTDRLKEAAETAMKNLLQSATNTEAISDVLNGPGRFVLPGGREFTMQDPIFTNAGDLMIGLAIKKGNSAVGRNSMVNSPKTSS